MKTLVKEIENCTICQEHLEQGCRPIFAAHKSSKIIIIGQAPGIKVHNSGIPWQDKSGDNLRKWLNVSINEFYDQKLFGIVPMGFCYPGKGKSGDLPPRKECAPQWHNLLLMNMTEVKLILLVGQYAQNYYLKEKSKKTLTDTVKNYKSYLPQYFPLPHPSPRNNIWIKKNPWFKDEVLPSLSMTIGEIIKQQ